MSAKSIIRIVRFEKRIVLNDLVDSFVVIALILDISITLSKRGNGKHETEANAKLKNPRINNCYEILSAIKKLRLTEA